MTRQAVHKLKMLCSRSKDSSEENGLDQSEVVDFAGACMCDIFGQYVCVRSKSYMSYTALACGTGMDSWFASRSAHARTVASLRKSYKLHISMHSPCILLVRACWVYCDA